MVDTGHVDMIALAGAHTELRRNGKQQAGPCPFCGGHDRFYVEADRWGCRQCAPGWSDALAFVARLEGHDLNTSEGMKAALAALDIEPEPMPQRSTRSRPENPVGDLSDDYAAFTDAYQHQADQFVTRTCTALHNPDGRAALDYLLHKRRMERCFIDAAMLGWNPAGFRSTWGDTEIYAPRGIVIPWEVDGTFWRIRFRTSKGYSQLAGAANGLYLPRIIMADSIVVLVEGEFDALALMSELVRWSRRTGYKSHMVAGVATGGTTNARALRHVVKLSLARRVLVAFDNDDNTAGEQAARWWCERLNNAVRWRPTRHDVNDMVISGQNMARWVQRGAAA